MEIVPVLIYEDISIPTEIDILHISFPTDEIGYVAGDTGVIFKTLDGGKSWIKLPVANEHHRSDCHGLQFFDAENGLCIFDGSIYHTSNGGKSWALKAYGEGIGITDDGIGYLARYRYMRGWEISRSQNKGNTFEYLYTTDIFSYPSSSINKIVFSDNRFTFLYQDDGWVTWLDPVSRTDGYFGVSGNAYTRPKEAYFYQDEAVVAGGGGAIYQSDVLSYSRVHYQHEYSYYSIHGFSNRAVAVGEGTIAANLAIDEYRTWQEIFQPNGSSFDQTFTKVRFTAENNFYIGGEKGLLWRARF